MATISLTLPTSGTGIMAGLHASNYTALQGAINSGLDTANWASGKIFPPSKLTQEGATSGQAIVWNGSQWAPASLSAVGYGTSLPGSPADGDQYVLVDSTTNPTFQWLFRYHSGSSNADKWEYVGGSAVVVEVATSEGTASTTYAALATAGPSFTVPRAGVYIVEIGCSVTVSANNGGGAMSYDIGGTGAVDADSLNQVSATTTPTPSGSFPRQKTGLAASTALVSKYKNTGAAATATFAKRWMRVTPVRVS